MRIILLALLILLTSVSTSKEMTNKQESRVAIESVVVYGIRSGPGLWKVSKGENTLWILGTLSPLPKRMVWESMQVESVIYDSQALLLPPVVSAEIGFFQGISLAASAIGMKKNPEKKKLKEVVPADIYARWLLLKKKYMGHNRGIEKSRPLFASSKLFDKAVAKIGLTYNTKVEKKVRKLAKKNKLELIRPMIKLDLDKPKAAIKKFKKTQLSDLECFSKTLDRLEEDVDNMRIRANAWANGSIAILNELTFPDQNQSCISAILNNDIAKDLGMEDIRERSRKLWLQKAKEALNTHNSTFAFLPISSLLGEKTVLQELAAEGYSVKLPN